MPTVRCSRVARTFAMPGRASSMRPWRGQGPPEGANIPSIAGSSSRSPKSLVTRSASAHRPSITSESTQYAAIQVPTMPAKPVDRAMSTARSGESDQLVEASEVAEAGRDTVVRHHRPMCGNVLLAACCVLDRHGERLLRVPRSSKAMVNVEPGINQCVGLSHLASDSDGRPCVFHRLRQVVGIDGAHRRNGQCLRPLVRRGRHRNRARAPSRPTSHTRPNDRRTGTCASAPARRHLGEPVARLAR